jgi:hypothetical protein
MQEPKHQKSFVRGLNSKCTKNLYIDLRNLESQKSQGSQDGQESYSQKPEYIKFYKMLESNMQLKLYNMLEQDMQLDLYNMLELEHQRSFVRDLIREGDLFVNLVENLANRGEQEECNKLSEWLIELEQITQQDSEKYSSDSSKTKGDDNNGIDNNGIDNNGIDNDDKRLDDFKVKSGKEVSSSDEKSIKPDGSSSLLDNPLLEVRTDDEKKEVLRDNVSESSSATNQDMVYRDNGSRGSISEKAKAEPSKNNRWRKFNFLWRRRGDGSSRNKGQSFLKSCWPCFRKPEIEE